MSPQQLCRCYQQSLVAAVTGSAIVACCLLFIFFPETLFPETTPTAQVSKGKVDQGIWTEPRTAAITGNSSQVPAALASLIDALQKLNFTKAAAALGDCPDVEKEIGQQAEGVTFLVFNDTEWDRLLYDSKDAGTAARILRHHVILGVKNGDDLLREAPSTYQTLLHGQPINTTLGRARGGIFLMRQGNMSLYNSKIAEADVWKIRNLGTPRIVVHSLDKTICCAAKPKPPPGNFWGTLDGGIDVVATDAAMNCNCTC